MACQFALRRNIFSSPYEKDADGRGKSEASPRRSPMDKLLEGGGIQKTNIHKVMKVCSSFKIKRRIQ
jgi:hypothetical protein